MKRPVVATIILLSLYTSGCASRGALTPHALASESIGEGSDVGLFVATSRQPSQDAGEGFSSARADRLSFRHYDVVLPANHKAGQIEWAGDAGNPSASFSSREDQSFTSSEAFSKALGLALAAQPVDKRDLVVFVHGYNTNFAEGLYRLAQFKNDAGLRAVSIFYSWPSGGRTLDYVYDRDSATFARDGLEQVLLLAAKSGAKRIFLMAHSMGTWLAMDTLRQASIGGRTEILGKLGAVVLIEPDIDIDVFRAQAARVRPFPKPFAVIVSSQDHALALSAEIAGGHTRVGQGKNIDDLRAMGITVIDLSKVNDGDRMHHGTYASSSEFLDFVSARLSRGESLLTPPSAAAATAADTGSDLFKISWPTSQ